MPATLISSRAHTEDHLALFCSSSGILVAAVEAAYQVWNDTSGTPVQVLPVGGGGTWQTVATAYRTGCYAVVDPLTALPWAPSASIARGRVEWRFKIASTDQYSYRSLAFEIVAAPTATKASCGIVLIQDARDAGVTTEAASDRTLLARIRLWQELIQRYCNRVFVPSYEARKIRACPNEQILYLPHNCPHLGSVASESDLAAIDLTYAAVEANSIDPADFGNPRVRLKSQSQSIFAPSTNLLGFDPDGYYVVTGLWGFVDPETLLAPEPIRDALLRCLYLDFVATGAPTFGAIRAETTDGHSVTYAPGATQIPGGMLTLLRDPAIRDLLDLYRNRICTMSGG